ncbi:N-6 DNA methylase [Pseudorhodobacter sp.]|uniref:Eco57I restriction-modification methylase domain-containing protein n=1 Tax=Pseudorhodobacter sp. TaxID=1934400 RepID=UPI0026475A7F|nr:N-6 DNA methylase [Pseudorhodobacter sp.]MDN5787500.1 N-6 DNA methylase [Pseudorhodobacter sp.]
MADAKSDGVTYTPRALADFVAGRVVSAAVPVCGRAARILDPAVGHGELLLALLDRLEGPVEVYGFETDPLALAEARARLSKEYPEAVLSLRLGSFLDHVLDDFAGGLFGVASPYDLIIANPPYVRTQIIGADRAQQLAQQFGLTGRVDLYHAFLLGMAKVLAPDGAAGFIVSNRFMTTKGGASARAGMVTNLRLREVYDLGDTKLFDAAVLPAVLIARGPEAEPSVSSFLSIYQTKADPSHTAADPIAALGHNGAVALPDGRTFLVQHGTLDTGGDPAGVWRLASAGVESWLATVAKHTWGTFREIGKTRVGIKTCADKVFVPKSWDRELELHRPLTTHHTAQRFRPEPPNRKVLYPHHLVDGRKQTVDLAEYPASRAYLEEHRETLEGRRYVIEAGRQWYEIWVPQNPADWPAPKLVFRDISEQPTFWMDLEGTVVNGDCYWLTGDEDLLWLALGVANSTFIERFYDLRFNNKLYAGRRRFITQYVEQFPVPDPTSSTARAIVAACRVLYARLADGPDPTLERQIDEMVWTAFGLPVEEI